MAKDDYFVIAYIILSYMYDCLKKGKNINPNDITNVKLNITENYLEYIFLHLYKDELIEQCGYSGEHNLSGEFVVVTERTRITPKGIEYLQENTQMAKAKSFLQESKEILESLPIIGKILY